MDYLFAPSLAALVVYEQVFLSEGEKSYYLYCLDSGIEGSPVVFSKLIIFLRLLVFIVLKPSDSTWLTPL